MERAAEILQQLKVWLADGLITEADYRETRQAVAATITFPTNLPPAAAHHGLGLLRQLRDAGLLSDAEFSEKKTVLLAAVVPAAAGTRRVPPQRPPSEGATEQVQLRDDATGRASSSTDGLDGQGAHENVGDKKYFAYYADFAHQELMLNDVVRTSTYQQAILQNRADFEGKVVIDVGAGTGILSMFAAQAGARKVYAIEASAMANTAEKIIAHNHWSHVIEVVKGKVEEVEVPELADVIISEPLGFWLFNEQMIQSYVAARDRWLRPGGKMFPCRSTLFIAPCYVPETRKAILSKASTWQAKQNFYGLDFTCAEADCRLQHLERMIVDQVFPSQVVAPPTAANVDFMTISVQELNDMGYAFAWEAPHNVLWDAVGLWYDTFFVGSGGTVCLSTRPNERLTCWYQTLCLLPEPRLQRKANNERTYDVNLYGGTEEDDRHRTIASFSFTLPVYRYYEHFQDMVWDITQFPDLLAGRVTPGAPPSDVSSNSVPPVGPRCSTQPPAASSAGTGHYPNGFSSTFQHQCTIGDLPDPAGSGGPPDSKRSKVSTDVLEAGQQGDDATGGGGSPVQMEADSS